MPTTSSDATARPTWARVEGDEIVINGAKSYVTRGADADFLNALVEIDGEGPSMVVIDTTAPGVSMARRFTTIDGHQHAGFELREVRVPRTNIIGRAGEGTNRAMREITATRLAIAALCVGSTRWILDYATAYLTAPGRGGAPRGAGERIRLRFGDMTIKAFAARSMLYRTARLEDAGENVINEAIACKVFASETVGEVADAAIQLVGGDALIVDHPLVQVANRMRSSRLAEGESDTLRVNIARGRLDLGKGRV